MYNKLQYISQGDTIHKQLYNIQQVLDNGCDWIQLRFKKASALELFSLAEAVKFLCEEYLATFIINDNVYLAQQLAADGVHLGLQDMPVAQARAILGNTKIIGGTANTLEDVLKRIKEDCDYIGLGPLRHTKTKQKLSPVLGLEGYVSITEKMKKINNQIPIYAIGGITLEDVENLNDNGIYGVALSGLLTKSENQEKTISALHQKLYVNI
jgi:thiamine-phosphate pyrophosphorylase